MHGRMVTGFSLDAMHTIDGGSAKDFLERLLEPLTKLPNGKFRGVLTPKGRRIVDSFFILGRKTWIAEPARYLR